MITKPQLRSLLHAEMLERMKQGYDVESLFSELESLPDSFDALMELAERLKNAPIKSGWQYVEPDGLDDTMTQCDPLRATGRMAAISPGDAMKRAKAAFMASVCGCILGKPLEQPPYGTLWDIRQAAQDAGEWPIRNYFSEQMLEYWGRRNPSWVETTRGRITYVAADDDINYTICGMLLLEQHGVEFTHDHMRQLWIENLPIYMCWGPERTVLLKSGIASMTPGLPCDIENWPVIFNPGQEWCGATIRADAYGYACPGYPELAARLAWKDASFTHRKTGVYATMFAAAAIATAFVADDAMDIFETALKYVPQKSRFYAQMSEALDLVRSANSFDEGYSLIHDRFSEYGPCRIIQEMGTVMNSLRFAGDSESCIALQVAQGNDTDSFGCTCGSICGAFFGDVLPEQWTAPFGDRIHTNLGNFNDRSLSSVLERMSRLYIHTENM